MNRIAMGLSLSLAMSPMTGWAAVVTGQLVSQSGEFLAGNVNLGRRGDSTIMSQPIDPLDFYVFENLPAGTYQITARSLGYGSSTRLIELIQDQQTTIDFVLMEAGEIYGNVVDAAGNAVQGATITVDYVETQEIHFVGGFSTIRATSDRNGYFHLPHISPERFFRLVVTHGSYTHTISEPTVLEPGQRRDAGRIQLSPGGVIEVEVPDLVAEGQNLRVVFVLIDLPDENPSPWNLRTFHRTLSKNGLATSPRWPVGSAVKVFAETSGRPSAHHVITQEGPVRLVFQSQP